MTQAVILFLVGIVKYDTQTYPLRNSNKNFTPVVLYPGNCFQNAWVCATFKLSRSIRHLYVYHLFTLHMPPPVLFGWVYSIITAFNQNWDFFFLFFPFLSALPRIFLYCDWSPPAVVGVIRRFGATAGGQPITVTDHLIPLTRSISFFIDTDIAPVRSIDIHQQFKLSGFFCVVYATRHASLFETRGSSRHERHHAS